MMNDGDPPIAGWYGKIPSLGDFISRRLPSDFIRTWDNWLQQAIATSRAQMGEQWLDSYMTSPIWRFILMPGICGDTLWAGILMPSVDKVGRCFPLMIAIPLDPRPGILLNILSAQTWYASLEQSALATLDVNVLPDDLDRSLAEYPFPDPHTGGLPGSEQEVQLVEWWQANPPAVPDNCRILSLSAVDLLPGLFGTAADNLFATLGSGRSIWWNVSPETGATRLHCCTGLPQTSHFSMLLSNTTLDDPRTLL